MPRYGYKTKRTVLKCGYLTQKQNEPLRRITAFISAVDAPRPLHRLILYLFKSKNASNPFKPPQPVRPLSQDEASSSSGGAGEVQLVQTRRKKKGRYPKEEDALPPLTLVTLLINKRYIFDYMKQELPI
jgi:hypothetical protein